MSGFYAVRGLNLPPNKRLGIDVSSMSGLVIHDIGPAKVAMQDGRNAPYGVDECADKAHGTITQITANSATATGITTEMQSQNSRRSFSVIMRSTPY